MNPDLYGISEWDIRDRSLAARNGIAGAGGLVILVAAYVVGLVIGVVVLAWRVS